MTRLTEKPERNAADAPHRRRHVGPPGPPGHPGRPGPTGHPGRPGGRRRDRAGMSLLELLVVVTIIGVLIGILVVGANTWRKSAKIKQTNATLNILEGVVDEYYTVRGYYFDSDVDTFALFLEAAEDVGEIFKLTGALQKDGADVVDGWNRPIRFYNPNPGPPPDHPLAARPVFWSDGPDEIDTSAARPWASGHGPYSVGNLVGYKSHVYKCVTAHVSAANLAPVEQGSTEWELTDAIGTFK